MFFSYRYSLCLSNFIQVGQKLRSHQGQSSQDIKDIKMQSHSEKDPHSCMVCKKTFTRKGNKLPSVRLAKQPVLQGLVVRINAIYML